MKVILAVLAVAWCHFIGVRCEPDYELPPQGRSVVVNYEDAINLPFLARSNHHHRHERPFSKVLSFGPPSYDDEYGSAGFHASPAPSPPSKSEYRLSHPNSLSSSAGEIKEGFEVVKAPVIYHETVVDKDSDLTKAVANAFGVVQTLRKPATRLQEVHRPVKTLTKVEFVNHELPQQSFRSNPGGTTTTTTTIVDIPQQIETLSGVTSTSPVIAQNIPPLPQAADLPPAPITVFATTAPQVAQVISSPVAVSPTKSSFTRPVVARQQGPSPKLIIPSQPHVTTLGEAVQSGDPQVRTIIQPVYIPYPVDQNGQPFGPLPDYHSMDFGALLTAQKQLISPAPSPVVGVVSSIPSTVQVVDTQNVLVQQPQLEQQQYIIQQDNVQDVAVLGSSPASETFGRRITGKRESTRNI